MRTQPKLLFYLQICAFYCAKRPPLHAFKHKNIVTVQIHYDDVVAYGTVSDMISGRNAETEIYTITGFAIIRAIRDAKAEQRSRLNVEVS